MSCCHPIPALDLGYRVNDSGQRVRNIKLLDMHHKHYGYGLEELKQQYGDQLLLLPCGHCYSCAVDYSRHWANRIMLEAGLHQANSFLTLTYSSSNLPGRLEKRPLQLFMKRLRKEVGKVRFFACGECGEGKGVRSFNPHYHVIIFGYDFPDKEILMKSESGMFIYRSPLLERLWPYGISSIGTVSQESASYVAKYAVKRKMTGIDRGEFVLMSRRPGIAAGSYDPDIWDTDRIYANGISFKPPRYFEKIADKQEDFFYYMAKFNREKRSKDRVSTKYLYGLEREEYALIKENEQRIYNDCLKVRNL